MIRNPSPDHRFRRLAAARPAVARLAALLLVACQGPADESPAPGPDGPDSLLSPLFRRVESRLEEAEAGLVELRRDLHRHPELSGQEARTAGVVAARLTALGLDVRTGIGGHGVVARLDGALPGGVLAVRADMDAVRSNDPDPVGFPSETPGVRHICGHDIHTTVALGVAEGLAAVRDELAGDVVFVFQPAEENVTGARAMIAAGALAEWPPQAILAFHTAPLEVGRIGTKPGVLLGSRGTPEAIAAGLPGTAPGAVNDPELEGATRDVIRAVVGADNLQVMTSVVPGFSEDFGHFQALVPGVMYWLGVSNSANGTEGMPHDPDYVADEGSILVGARVMSALVLDGLARRRGGE